MKKSHVSSLMQATACLLLLGGAGQSAATTYIDSNYTVFSSGVNETFGGTNDIAATWDDTLNTSVDSTNFNMSLGSGSDAPFFGFAWSVHHVRIFGPGSYSFDTTCSVGQLESGISSCGGSSADYLDLVIGTDQIGAHMLWNWNGNVVENVDIAVLWDIDGVSDSTLPHRI